MKTTAVVSIDDLSFKYNGASTFLLKNINLNIGKGEQVGIIGGNGCGKSTLSKILLGIFQPTAGSIKMFGRKVNWDSHFPEVAYIGDPGHNAEELGLPVDLTIWETIEVISSLYSIEKVDTNPVEKLKHLGLYDLRHRYIRQLSTGERKRLMICLAFLKLPKLIILDEPFDGLDEHIINYVEELVKSAINQDEVSILLISHSIIEIDTYANKVYRLHNKELAIVNQKKFNGSIELEGRVNKIDGKAGEIIGMLSDVLTNTDSIGSISIKLNENK